MDRNGKASEGREEGDEARVNLELLTETEHLRALFRHYHVVFLANLSASVTLTIGLWGVVDRRALLAWLLLTIVFGGVRWAVSRSHARVRIAADELARLNRLFLGGVVVSGLLWGSAGVLFYVPDRPEHSIFLALVLIGIASASTAALSFHRHAFALFFVLATAPLVVRLLRDDGTVQTILGLVIPIYFALLLVMSREIYRFSHDAIVSGIRNHHSALVDHLTGSYNRRAFEEFLDKEWQRAIRSDRPISLLIADIDDFKLYNDRYGHAVGDEVLRAVAGLFRSRIRRGTDIAARIGGEEFAIVLPETGLDGALVLAHELRNARIAAAAESTAEQSWPFPTFSIGVASAMPSPELSAFALFDEADKALYAAKKAGKDRIFSQIADGRPEAGA